MKKYLRVSLFVLALLPVGGFDGCDQPPKPCIVPVHCPRGVDCSRAACPTT